ncbi:hypothetical protein B9Q17_00845 [Marinobacter vinifirmus]|uniref:Uncharacterized protein n=1 Tax=Marinobacter vinifirmus TaxID=355591 RepID=A0A7Z1DVG8_9GAMM|nr:hypothetical protein [Marinobacter vinifirmus]OZC35627.1 hypothetical protein B9Q17_00845 [Marinobacter vinifirmus]
MTNTPPRRIPDHADFNGDPSGNDPKAEKEASYFANGKDLERSERIKGLLNWVAMLTIAVAAVGVLLCLVSWFYHLLTPDHYHFLKDEQIRRIETVVFSGMLVGLAQKYLSKHL